MKVVEAIQFLPLSTMLEVVDSSNRHFFIIVCDKILLVHVGDGFKMCKYELFNTMQVNSIYILSMVDINLFFLSDVLENFPNHVKKTYTPDWEEGKEEASLLYWGLQRGINYLPQNIRCKESDFIKFLNIYLKKFQNAKIRSNCWEIPSSYVARGTYVSY